MTSVTNLNFRNSENIKEIQFGEFTIASTLIPLKTGSVVFEDTFSSTPEVFATINTDNISITTLVQNINVYDITTTGFSYNVYRLDVLGGLWNSNIKGMFLAILK
tara:strand:- start:220 stop:534 length:315 start_codon:yes stop_codon:yes gene_type:complete